MKNMKWLGMLSALLCAAMLLGSCGSGSGSNNNNNSQNGQNTEQGDVNDNNDDNAADPDINVDGSMLIKLDDAKTDVGNSGATYKDCVLTIAKAGVYRLQGKLTDGQIYVAVGKTETVELILDGCEITCKTGAAIYCVSADKLYVTANAGSTNVLSDGANYIYSAVGTDEPNACLFSDDDITLRGSGTLTVNGNFNNGISSKNDIKIKDLNLTVNAKNTAIRGKDSVEINSGKVNVDAGKDGLKANRTDKTDKGFIEINGGEVYISAGDDALQAYASISVNAGKVTLECAGKCYNCDAGDQYVFVAEGTVTEK